MQLVAADHPALRAIAHPVTDFGEARRIADAMARLLKQRKGFALAAPQVGVSLRLVVFSERAAPLPWAVVNPELSFPFLDETVQSDEGCLSIPGRRVLVTRRRAVDLTGRYLGGADLSLSLKGLPAASPSTRSTTSTASS